MGYLYFSVKFLGEFRDRFRSRGVRLGLGRKERVFLVLGDRSW